VASETASPTQPIRQPVQLARNSFDLSEVADVTPEHRAACQALIAKDNLKGSKRFEPIPADHPSSVFPAAKADRNGRAAPSIQLACSSSTPTISLYRKR